MNFNYFLGANSAVGFYSLYDGFCRGEGDYLTVIKGGPGTGKSGFMRRIGRQAEKTGLDVEYVICSGDTGSLDGVYIPALHRGWVDGTAPHVSDPKSFGVLGDYVNLGQFCKTPLSEGKRKQAKQYFDVYRKHYERAYRCLNAAAAVGNIPDKSDVKAVSAVSDGLLDMINDKNLSLSNGKTRKIFLQCLSGEGEISLNDEVSKLCGKVFSIGCAGFDSAVLGDMMQKLSLRGITAVVCLSPLEPEKCSAVLLPQLDMGFVGSGFEIKSAHPIDIPFEQTENERGISEVKREMLALSVGELKKAKDVHDKLEDIFKSETDFDALTEYTERYVGRLFS